MIQIKRQYLPIGWNRSMKSKQYINEYTKYFQKKKNLTIISVHTTFFFFMRTKKSKMQIEYEIGMHELLKF